MTHVLIVEGDSALARRISAVLTREQITVVPGPTEAAEAIANSIIDIGVASSASFRDKLTLPNLALISWILLTDSVDDELAVHRNCPELHAQFLVKDIEQRYFELLPLRIRSVPIRERVVATIAHEFPGMVAYWGADERCQFANASYEEWFGVAPRELLGTSLGKLLGSIYPLNVPYIRAALRGETQRFERSVPHPDGERSWHALVTYTPDIQDGTVRGFVAITTNITEEYLLRQALLERDRRWATLFDILPVGVTVIDAHGAVVEVNHAIQRILGIDREGVKQGTYRSRTYVHSDGRPMLPNEFPSFRALAEREVVGPVEIGVIRENNATVWTSVTAAPFPNDDKVVVVTRDTTAEKANATRFEAIVGTSPIPHAINDDRGNITYVNPAFVIMFGYTREDILTLDHWWPQAYPDPTYRAWVVTEWAARLEKSKRDHTAFDPLELAIRAKDGSERLAMASAVALEGSFAGEHLVVFIDLTERRNAERQLEESRRLASLGALAGGIAHDFNNLLTPILAHVDVALAELPLHSPLHTSLSEVHTAASRAAGLVRQILTMSRPGEDSKTRIDLVPLVDEVTVVLRASLPSTISIQTNIEPRGLALFANPTRIHQVILNLATNARDAMATSGGMLTIMVARIEPNILKLSVKDTGTGITPELLHRVFDPYFTTKIRSGGTGLGLATVRAIVASLGGSINIDSEPGKGTTVDVLIPALNEVRSVRRVDTRPEKRSPPITSQQQHILVVDDEPLVGRAAVRMLTRLGYRATLANSPAEALDAFQADLSFAAVLTDYTMPGMSGLEVAQKLCAIRPTRILIATGLAENLTEASLHEAKVQRILLKPYGMAALSDALASILSAED